jgi:alkylation response protein AidB-like acyl-CoA dehydrogenase
MELSDEQRMLQESAAAYLQDNYSFDQRQATVRSSEWFSARQWQQFADMGWLAMPLPESQGGFDCGPVEIMLLCEQMGRHLVIEPYIETVVQVGELLQRGAGADVLSHYLPRIGDGSLQAALAHDERGSQPSLGNVLTRARASGDEFVLSGSKAVVRNGAAADLFVVSALTDNGVCLFLVDANADGVGRRCYPTHDGRQACDLELTDVRVPTRANLGAAGPLLEAAGNVTLLAACAEAMGSMDALLQGTLEYTRQRRQFGRSLSEFQVLRHRMTDMFMQAELNRSLLLAAARELAADGADSVRLLSALKARTVQAGRFVGQNAIQLHGGIAMTEELKIGHYFKRLTALESWFGSRDFHLQRFADLAAAG